MTPAKLERCVKKVKRTIKPRKGQTKKSAAFGVCTASLKSNKK